MQSKEHYKLYKSGKLWLTMAIAAITFSVSTISGNSSVHADMVKATQVQTTQVAQPSQANNENYTLETKTVSAAAISQQINNRVPQDTTTQNNEVNANQGHLDSYGLTENTQGQTQLTASGWHATGQSNPDPYRYMIVYDNTVGHEIARQKLTPQSRPDVQRAYQHIDNSLNSGFNVTINIPNGATNHSLSLVDRYSSDAVNGEGNHVDYWFGPLVMDESNRAYLDSIKVNKNNQLEASGWHATNQTAGRPYHYIIAWDQNLGHEVARQLVSPVTRNDVKLAFPTIANAARSGFSVQFPTSDFNGHDRIQFISRWTNDSAGNGNAVDYWFNPLSQRNEGYLDGYTLNNGKLSFYGWHASDSALFQPYHYLIVYDLTMGHQIASERVATTSSTDVAKVLPTIRTANNARFNYQFNNLSLNPGHTYCLISRYAFSDQGNGDDGNPHDMTDYWYHSFVLNQEAFHVDSLVMDNHVLTITGWLASDKHLNRPYVYAILMQKNRELNRQAIRQLITRMDVGKTFPQIYQSDQSGFSVTFNTDRLDPSKGSFSLILRFTDDPMGNGHFADMETGNYVTNAGNFDAITTANNGLQISGWHAITPQENLRYQYIIAINAKRGNELGRWLVQPTVVQRPDVRQAYPWIGGSNQSGFVVTIPQQTFNDQFVKFIHRYTDDPAGNGRYVDTMSRMCYFDPQSHKLVKNSFLSLPNQDRTIYFGNDGQIALGNVNIDGHLYHFDNRNGKLYCFSQRVIDWFRSRRGRITYSQWGSRNGDDGTADCSGSITQAIRDAGGFNYGHIYHDNYDTKHQDFYNYIIDNGYHKVYEGQAQFTPQYGDIIVLNPWINDGHVVVISSFGNNPNDISVNYYTHGQSGTAVQELNYNWDWNHRGRPNQLVFRPNDLSRA